MKVLLIAFAILVTACTPAQMTLFNQAQANRGLPNLTHERAEDLWCSVTAAERVAYLGWDLIFEMQAEGGVPNCPTSQPAGWVDSGIGGVWVPPIEAAIRRCESGGNPTAQNSVSTASGLHQWLDSSWHGYGHAHRYGVSKARYATPAQQMEAFVIGYERSGTTPWNASRHCWG